MRPIVGSRASVLESPNTARSVDLSERSKRRQVSHRPEKERISPPRGPGVDDPGHDAECRIARRPAPGSDAPFVAYSSSPPRPNAELVFPKLPISSATLS